MGYVGLKINKEEEKDLEELENLLREMDPYQKIGSRSATIKEAVRIALFHIKRSYWFQRNEFIKLKGKTTRRKPSSAAHRTRYITKIPSSAIDLDGKRRD